MDKQEILRYLGAESSVPSLDPLIQRAEQEVIRASRPKSIYQLFPLMVNQDSVTLAGTCLESRTLSDHLRGCHKAFLFAFTLGPGVDALIRRYELMNMPMVPVLQACAAAYTEEQADFAQKEMERFAGQRGWFLRPRYSPGYGDFSLSYQKFFFNTLEISKRIGVTLTSSYLMLPMKSITAIVGVSQDPSLCHVGRCMTCTAENCPFRKRDPGESSH